ncbi:MAG: hypothetical protein ABSC32_16905 [Steroidobacteraceae bacterium]|jgi:hypothetical protein
MSSGAPQFTTAEYAGKPDETTCKACRQAIGGAHYRINGAKICSNCAQRINDQIPKDSHPVFVRGVLFGVGGAVLGLAIYVGFALATGLISGFISLAVGYLVGKAIVMGSGGLGGRRYQIAAVLLTYIAVSLSAVPIALSQHLKQRSAQAHMQVTDSTSASPKPGLAKAIGMWALIGLTSPFLALSNPTQGLIGLVILFVGIRIAWRMTAGKQVIILGPLGEASPTAAG